MEIVCLDLEGVLVPEIWIALAERTGIAQLGVTTRGAGRPCLGGEGAMIAPRLAVGAGEPRPRDAARRENHG